MVSIKKTSKTSRFRGFKVGGEYRSRTDDLLHAISIFAKFNSIQICSNNS